MKSPAAGDDPGAESSTPPGAPAFDQIPPELRVRAFGVDYGHVRTSEGGDLYVTHYGWPYLAQLQPENWYTDEWYAKHGERLPGSTGHVYHLLTRPVGGTSADLVVKFSRVAQEVSIVVETSFPDDIDPQMLASARFNSPMEEFGLVMELRRGVYGPRQPRILAQRPLAIYAPPEEFDLWQLGRDRGSFHAHHQLLAENQETDLKAIEFDIKRIYVLLYGWIEGRDAEQSFETGDINEEEFLALTPRVVRELNEKGFRVLDNKPKHFILRRRQRDGGVLRRRDGRIAYGLVDFEFLQRTQEHQRQFKATQRERYWYLQTHTQPAAPPPASHLKPMTVFGVGYLFGSSPDGGRVWLVGRDADLFDYFLPDRWRRTPRVKLSATNEVYRTRTRDNIHIVYRRSRVGATPRIDPLQPRAKQIRDHGFNSPFEEVAIAERLRQMGIPTTYPRAICRTGHGTIQAAYLRDERRFAEHAHLRIPTDPQEALLSPDHDYYTIWDWFRGIDPETQDQSQGAHGVYDLVRASEDNLISKEEYEAAVARTRARLRDRGLPTGIADSDEFLVLVGRDGIRRDNEGEAEIIFCIDALSAYEYRLLDETEYREAVGRLETKLRAVDCEKLNLTGKHLLLSMDPDGKFKSDDSGELAVTLCNFELIRGLYRPIY